MKRPVSIFALTQVGNDLAHSIGRYLSNAKISNDTIENVDIHFKPTPFAETVQNAFLQKHALIMICASGIAVRSLAPVINDKYQDPPVLLLDEHGKFVVPLLSGHEGGANQWGDNIAEAINAQLVLTTANSYLNPIYTVGMGCERYCDQNHLHDLLHLCLDKAGLTLDQVKSINSIDVKADEQGLLQLAAALDKPYQVFDKQVLNTVENQLSTKSDYIYSVVGVYGVAESAALVAAKKQTNSQAELVLTKHKTEKATCAIARSYT